MLARGSCLVTRRAVVVTVCVFAIPRGHNFWKLKKASLFCELNLDRHLEYPKSFETPSNEGTEGTV